MFPAPFVDFGYITPYGFRQSFLVSLEQDAVLLVTPDILRFEQINMLLPHSFLGILFELALRDLVDHIENVIYLHSDVLQAFDPISLILDQKL